MQKHFEDYPEKEKRIRSKAKVYYAVVNNQPVTSLELSSILSMSIHTIMPRLTELKKAGYIEVVAQESINNKSYNVYQVAGGVVHMQ